MILQCSNIDYFDRISQSYFEIYRPSPPCNDLEEVDEKTRYATLVANELDGRFTSVGATNSTSTNVSLLQITRIVTLVLFTIMRNGA